MAKSVRKRPVCGLDCGPGLAKQEFKEDVDINNIIKKFSKTGQFNMTQFKAPGVSADLSKAFDFHQALGIIRKGEQIFASLPSNVRDRFQNDPEQFLSFMEDPKNLDEAIELKLVKGAPAPPLPLKVEVINPPVAAAGDGKAGSA